MRIDNGSDTGRLTGTSMAVNIQSKPFLIEHIYAYSFTIVWTGAPTGSIKLQASNDPTMDEASVAGWVDISSSTYAVAGAGNLLYNMPDIAYRWVRFTYTATAGAGTVTTFSWTLKGV